MKREQTNEEAALASTIEHMQGQNPANEQGRNEGRTRIPMTSPMRRMEVPELPGFWLQWIRATPERMQQANRAFFEHVYEGELDINNRDIGGDAKTSGNTDMGTIVSCGDGSGELGPDRQPIRMVLMKQRKEYHDEDVAINQKRNDSVVDSLTVNFRQGTIGAADAKGPGETQDDVSKRYVGNQSKIPKLFQRKS